MDISWLLGGTGSIVLGVIFLLLGLGVIGKVRKKDTFKYLGIFIIALGLFFGGIGAFWEKVVGGQALTIAEAEEKGPAEFIRVGAGATIDMQAYTGDWGGVSAKTEVYPVYTCFDSNGDIIVNDAGANTTSSAVGEVLDCYGTGATYYLDPLLDKEVNNERPTFEFKAYTVPTTANMDIVVYDNTGATALTADDNANNTADYAGGNLGAGENEIYFARFKTKVADKVFRLGAVCTYYCGDEVDDFTLEGTESSSSGVPTPSWTEVDVPSGTMTTTFSMYDDVNTSTTCSYKRCYVPSGMDYVELQEWDWIKLEFNIDTDDTTQPTANGDSYVGAVFLDYSCNLAKNGGIHCSWWNDDTDKDPGAIGLDENPETAGYKGLDIGFAIEPQ